MRIRLTLIGLLAAVSAFGQMNVTGNISASQVTSGQFSISLIPTGTTSSTAAIGNDARFLNATKLNGTDISTLTGLLKLTSGTPSNAAAADIGALWGCSIGTPVLTYNGTAASCIAAGSGGSVTSVALTSPSFFAVAGSPITTNGTLALSYATGLTGNENQVLGVNASGAAGLLSITGAMLPNPSASSLGGVESFSAPSHQWINSISTSGVPTASQPAFSDLSGSVTTAQLPSSIPVWTKYTVPFGTTNAAATTQAVNLVALTARQAVCGVIEKTTAAFAGTGITGLTVTVGDSNGTSGTYAPSAYNLTAAVSNTNFIADNVVGMASFAGGNVQANFTSTGANLSALTAGSVDFDVCIVTLP